jgi:hypothetical protein
MNTRFILQRRYARGKKVEKPIPDVPALNFSAVFLVA